MTLLLLNEAFFFSENHDNKSFSLVKNKWVELASRAAPFVHAGYRARTCANTEICTCTRGN